MDQRHIDKMHELIDTLASTIKVEAERLARSGGVPVDEYDPDGYVLAKICVTAAMRAHANDYEPLYNKTTQRMIENLEKF